MILVCWLFGNSYTFNILNKQVAFTLARGYTQSFPVTCHKTKIETMFLLHISLGGCLELSPINGGTISYDFNLEPPFPRRPEGTVATYVCTAGMIMGNILRRCNNGVWSGIEPSCGKYTNCMQVSSSLCVLRQVIWSSQIKAVLAQNWVAFLWLPVIWVNSVNYKRPF